ncbi:MAG: Pyridoxal 4-dehydrogenase [Devosia sp.]|uniref:aldo/keto reductase n=1 Tax=Devosia sp. TaxID=1871048 RepID=UPI002639C379|nr:aldo/keto reductase [Devosia sp.]MDB5538886.1 Pyridoxal 4-dehydrogenase [Devosia sp.]
MDPFKLRRLGRTTVELPQLGFGGAAFGNIFEVIEDAQADTTMAAAWEAGVRFYDTSPWYGRGLSEHRIGRGLYLRPRDEVILSTKVGRLFTSPKDVAAFERSERAWPNGLKFEHHHDYTHAGVMRSYEDSLQRLGMNRIDLLIIHDLDLVNLGSEELVEHHLRELVDGGGLRALQELKASGLVEAIGAGVNRLGTIPRFLERMDLDFFLVALPYTLAEQPVLDEEFPLCEARGVGVIIGGVFASGILATGPVPGARYNYEIANAGQLEKIRRMQAVCARHGVPLAAAALQFTLHHPIVASVIPGAFHPDHPRRNVESMRVEAPDALWAELKHEGLLRADAPTP